MRATAIAIIYAALLAGGLYLANKPTLESRFALLQTDPGDTMLNFYLLEHSWRAVADANYHYSLWSPPFFYPAPYVLGYSESLIGAAPVYWLLRLALPPEIAYPSWMMAMEALNFIAFAVVARWLRCRHVEAMLGAYLWAFAVVHAHQAGHQQLIPRFWMPFAMYHGIRFAIRPSARELRAGLIFVFLQTTACVNTGVFLGYGLLAFTVIAPSVRGHGWRRLRRAFAADRRGFFLALFTGCGLCFLALLPLVVANIGSGTARSYTESVPFIPPLRAWLTPAPHWRWQKTLGFLRDDVSYECLLFGGIGYFVLFLASLLPLALCRGRRRFESWIAFSCGATAIALIAITTKNDDGDSLWQVARFIPGGVTIRVVARIFVPIYLLVTIGGIIGLRLLVDRITPLARMRTLIVAVLAAGIIYEQTGFSPPAFEPASTINQPIQDLAALMHGADVAFVRTSEPGGWDCYVQLRTMWAGLHANVPVMNGYSGRMPTDYPTLCNCSDEEIRDWLGPDFHGRVAIIDPDRLTVRHLQLP